MKVRIVILVLFLCAGVFAAEEVITGRYCYQYGDNETLLEARQLTRTLALRNAIESYHVFVEAAAIVDNFQITNDIVQSLTGTYIKNIQIAEQTETDHKVCMTVIGSIDPAVFDTILKNQVRRRIQLVQQMGIDNNGALKVLSVSPIKFNDKGQKVIETVVKVLEHTGRLDSVQFRNSKPEFKVCITYFDRSGTEMSGDSQFIHTQADGLASGEIRTVAFKDPPIGAVTWRVWLIK